LSSASRGVAPPLDQGARASQLALGLAELLGGGAALGLGLGDLLAARAGQELGEARRGGLDLRRGLRAPRLQLGAVEARELGAGSDGVALVGPYREQPAAGLETHPRLGRLDGARSAQHALGRALPARPPPPPAAGGEGHEQQHDHRDRGLPSHRALSRTA
jgi:hypothetical protein